MPREHRLKRILPRKEKVTVTVKLNGVRAKIRRPLHKSLKVILVINNQFTDAGNTTQIASGAGRSSAAGNNAAIDSSNTEQQQSVGAGGEATNTGMRGEQSETHRKHCRHRKHHHRHHHHRHHHHPNKRHHRHHPSHPPHPSHREREKDDIVVVLNNQINRSKNNQSVSAATQVASGGQTYSAGGTNAAIESSNTKQQHAVGGAPGAKALNSGMNNNQIEAAAN
jgi:hypothetical protein